MLALKLAYRNLVGAGLRTWLNVIVLSMSFVIIIWHRGLLQGWDNQAKRDMINWDIGAGHLWHEVYDPYDPFTLVDSHGPIPSALIEQSKNGSIVPILVTQTTIYPQGRMQTAILKGIDIDQKVISMPTAMMKAEGAYIPALIGKRMARNTNLEIGAQMMIRWRDANGTFDAAEVTIVGIFNSNVPKIDNGQIWIPLNKLQEMLQMPNEATYVIIGEQYAGPKSFKGWNFKAPTVLTKDIDDMIASKQVGGSILYLLLMSLAMLAIFDTQVLSIFRRQREIGTHIALGMTRRQVVSLFTIEGTLHAVLAAMVGAVYGIPFLAWQATAGWTMPAATDSYGFSIAETIYPAYSIGLIIITVIIVLVTTTIVSYLPARKISKLNPTDAIRGKIK